MKLLNLNSFITKILVTSAHVFNNTKHNGDILFVVFLAVESKTSTLSELINLLSQI